MAFEQRPCVQLAMTVVTTGRAAKAIRPAHLVHRLAALLFGPELTEELFQTHAFLKLHLELAHVVTPVLSGSYDVTIGPSQYLIKVDNQENLCGSFRSPLKIMLTNLRYLRKEKAQPSFVIMRVDSPEVW